MTTKSKVYGGHARNVYQFEAGEVPFNHDGVRVLVEQTHGDFQTFGVYVNGKRAGRTTNYIKAVGLGVVKKLAKGGDFKAIASASTMREFKAEVDNNPAFISYTDTFFQISAVIGVELMKDTPCRVVRELMESQGRTALFDMARELAFKFEQQYHGYEWDGEYYEVLDQFISDNIN